MRGCVAAGSIRREDEAWPWGAEGRMAWKKDGGSWKEDRSRGLSAARPALDRRTGGEEGRPWRGGGWQWPGLAGGRPQAAALRQQGEPAPWTSDGRAASARGMRRQGPGALQRRGEAGGSTALEGTKRRGGSERRGGPTADGAQEGGRGRGARPGGVPAARRKEATGAARGDSRGDRRLLVKGRTGKGLLALATGRAGRPGGEEARRRGRGPC